MLNLPNLDLEERLAEIETLDLCKIDSSTVLKLSPIVKRWCVRGDSSGTYGMCPPRQLTSGGRFLHVAKRSPMLKFTTADRISGGTIYFVTPAGLLLLHVRTIQGLEANRKLALPGLATD